MNPAGIPTEEASQDSWMELDGTPGLDPGLHFVEKLHRELTV